MHEVDKKLSSRGNFKWRRAPQDPLYTTIRILRANKLPPPATSVSSIYARGSVGNGGLSSKAHFMNKYGTSFAYEYFGGGGGANRNRKNAWLLAKYRQTAPEISLYYIYLKQNFHLKSSLQFSLCSLKTLYIIFRPGLKQLRRLLKEREREREHI